jgi:ubiquinol oxidase
MADAEVRPATLPPQPFSSAFEADYGSFGSLADLFRQIGHDERVHKQESLAQMRQPHFS